MTATSPYLNRPTLSERERRLVDALKSCRYMLHAWRGARLNAGLPDNHSELNSTIAQIESLIREMTGEG